jgi:hypothetical protein
MKNNELEKRYSTLEPEELIKIVNSPKEYTANALEVATSELRRRNLSSQNLLSSKNLTDIDLVKMALATDREKDIDVILTELKKRNIWENITRFLQTELGYSTNKILDEVVPEGMRFTEKFEELLDINQLNLTKNENVNIILVIFNHIAKDIVEGKEGKSIFRRLRDIGVNANLISQVIEPFYYRVKSSLSKQKPHPRSYIYALFAGILSSIIGGVGYGYYMLNTNSKLNYILVLLGVLSGVLIHILTGGKKGVVIALIGIFSTSLSIFLGNYIFAVNRSSPLHITTFDFIYGMVGVAFVIGLSRAIEIKK